MVSTEGRFCIGIGVIMENKITGTILLLRRSSDLEFGAGIWDDIGGRMHQFETPEEALRREVSEETGLSDFVILKPIDVSNYYRGEKKAENQMVVITYWCQTDKLDITLSPEHDAYQWLSPKKALTLTEDPNIQRLIQQFMDEKRHTSG